jgi:hypothetical protein
VLQTGEIDGLSLAEHGPLELEEVAGVAAAVASTLADLHGMGLVHGAVSPGHVVLDRDGRPVLCGLGYGGLAGEPILQAVELGAEFVDAARADAAVLDPAVDVFGVGALILLLLDRGNGRVRGLGGEALRSVARRATADDVASRPTARQVADSAHDAVAIPRLPRPEGAAPAPAPAPATAPSPHRPLEGWRRTLAPPPLARRRRLRTIALVTFALVGGAAALAVVVQGRMGRHPPLPTAAPAATMTTMAAGATTAAAVTTSLRPTTTAPVAVAGTVAAARPRVGPAGCATADGPLAADVNGDGCPESLRFADGVVTAGVLRWSVGEAGDEIAVGDWACSGTRSLAVLRPRTGEVFAFARWAGPANDVEAPLVGAVAGGRALRAADLDGDGCNELVVERASGAPVVLRAPRTGP